MKTAITNLYYLDGEDIALLKRALESALVTDLHRERAQALYRALTYPSAQPARFVLAPILDN